MARSTSKLLPVEETKEEVKEEVLDTPVIPEAPKDDGIQDVHIEGATRKRFRINGDNNKILELNTNDIGVSYRLQEAYDRLNNLMEQVTQKLEGLPDAEEIGDDSYRTMSDSLKELNDAMCREVDYIFDAPVSKICLDGTSMYAPANGMFMYEHIINQITDLYESSLNYEFRLMKQRVSERTKRYASATKKKYRPNK